MNLLAQARLTNPLTPSLSPNSPADAASSFSKLVATAIQWLFVAGLLVFVLFFFISGFKWITSQGDKNSLQSAREGLLHAIIGLIILLSLFAVLKLIEMVFHVCIMQIPIPVFGQLSSSYCLGTTDTHPTFVPGGNF